MKSTIIDAGPLIALFSKNDRYHVKTLGFLKKYKGRLVSTWPVLTEVCHLLSSNQKIYFDFLDWVHIGGVQIVDIEKSKISRIIELSKKYRDLPMDLADASLIVVAEELKLKEIISIDSDYEIYRIHKREKLRNVLKEHQ